MNTGSFIKVEDILFKAAAMAGDQEYKVIPKGFYIALISDALKEFELDSMFTIARKDFDMPTDNLSIPLPEDCFNLKEVYVYSGDACTISNSKKLWWKRNYYTTGNGYFAKDKGNNGNDPYYLTHNNYGEDKSLIRYNNQDSVNNLLFYGVQMGVLMLSSSVLSAGSKIHIVYNSTGSSVLDAPIIPLFCKQAVEDFVTESALRFRMANEPSNIRAWMPLQQMYAIRLDKEGKNGSWFNAIMRVRNLDDAERNDLNNYYGRGSWAVGR
jgi:hypothetical protein